MNDFLDNPVFHSLSGADAHLGSGTEAVKYFDENVSPFAGFPIGYENGFAELQSLLPARRRMLIASRKALPEPPGWEMEHRVAGLQFVHTRKSNAATTLQPVALGVSNVEEMVALTKLTKPGPFSSRTIEFGHYYGFFENGRLAAMAGQRLHAGPYSEISAVCTHPDFLGKGYAAALLLHQVQLIREQGQIPFLHVRADNARAIALYERTGFNVNGKMYFHVMRSQGAIF